MTALFYLICLPSAAALGSLLVNLGPEFALSSDVVFTRSRWDSNLSKGIASMIPSIDFARVNLLESNSAPESAWAHSYL